MARKALTEEEKQSYIEKYISVFLVDKNQDFKNEFNTKDTDKRYSAIRGFINRQKKKEQPKTDEKISVSEVLGKALKQTTETYALISLKNEVESFLPKIEEKIEGNKKKDEIAKLEKAIEAMKAAELDTTEVEAKLAELKK